MKIQTKKREKQMIDSSQKYHSLEDEELGAAAVLLSPVTSMEDGVKEL